MGYNAILFLNTDIITTYITLNCYKFMIKYCLEVEFLLKVSIP